MKNIMTLQQRGKLTEQQVLVAYKFHRDPKSYTLAPTLYRVLHRAIIDEEPLEALESSMGWPARSAKAIIGIILHAMQEMKGTHVDHEELPEDEKAMLTYVLADDTRELTPLVKKYGFTPTEARLFAIMERSPGRQVGKDAIHTRLYAHNMDEAPDPKILDVLICRMRKKLEGSQYHIETVRGIGYELVKTEPEPDNRDVLWYVQHVHKGYPYRAIAKAFDVQPSTVMRAINRTVETYDPDDLEKAALDYLSDVGA